MMSTMTLEDAVGSQWRAPEAGRKAHRAAALLYAPAPRLGGRAPVWTQGERWILSGGGPGQAVRYFIGEAVREEASGALEPPFARPGLTRLAALAYADVPGPVIVERSRELTHPAVLAALAGYLTSRGRAMVTWRAAGDQRPPFEVTPGQCQAWIEQCGKSRATIASWVDKLQEVAHDGFLALLDERSLNGLTHLGDGPERTPELARQAALEREAAGWDDQQIRNYLSLHGFTNCSGNVGTWSYAQFERLMAGVR